MRRLTAIRGVLVAVIATGGIAVGTIPAAGTPPPPTSPAGLPEVSAAVHSDVSPPLRDIPVAPRARSLTEKPLFSVPGGNAPSFANDPALQTTTGPLVGITAGLNFAGVGNGDYGFTPNAAPPDTNGAVGATQYVQWVNESFAVFNKDNGALVFGPVVGNTLWAGFGGGCQTNNDGDPIVQYDKIANRWVMTQFSVSTTPYLQCVAVSTTSDATGSYNRYAFSYGTVQFNDYPKLGVWPDAYYVSFNIFNNGKTFAGSKACAYDRTSMLSGGAATQVCFQLSSSFGGLLPSDLDGASASLQLGGVARPPAGSPNYFLNFGSNSLNLWKFHVDFATPANSTFIGPTNIPVATFAPACNGGACIPQPSTRQQLDSLADRLMYRLAYRHFTDGHESLVVNHSVTTGSSVGVRWYEIRSPNATPTVFQQGTYAPDATYRWMGSIAMDQRGDIALGYSASSSTVLPSIRYTGRLASDTPNIMQAENSIEVGGGSQLRNLSRWGDYSAMTVDPVDDCTFWFTSEYLKSSGTFNWSTRISAFSFPGCSTYVSPAAPTGLAAVDHPADQGGALDLSWTPSVSTNVTQQRLYRSTTNGGPYVLVATITNNTTATYTDGGLTANTAYYYVLRAYDGTSESVNSNQASATPLDNTTTNLALGKTATASSIYGAGFEATKAVDGNLTTRWSSQFSDPQWLMVDLGATYAISSVKLSWDPAYATAYRIDVSNDASTWTTIYSTTTGGGGIEQLTGLAGSGRYVRMYGTARGTIYGYSLWEMEVYGSSP